MISYIKKIKLNLEIISQNYCAKSQERISKANNSFRPDYVLIDAGYVSISLITGIAAKTIQKISKPLYNLENTFK